MAGVAPARLRFVSSGWQDEVPSPPHDALSLDDRRQHLRDHPRSYLGVTRAPEDWPDEPDPAAQAIRAGRTALVQLLADGAFGPAEGPTYFIYRLEADGHRQTGLVCTVSTTDYDAGTVRIHERINRTRSAHLAAHLRGVGAQSSPIALAYRNVPAVTRILNDTVAGQEPFLTIVDDRLDQCLWRVADQHVETVSAAFDGQPLYLIDGHHRAAAASADLADHGPGPDGDHAMLAVVFPYEELRTRAFHRVVTGIDTAELAETLSGRFQSRRTDDAVVVADRPASELAIALPRPDGGPDWLLIDIPFDDPSPMALANIDPIRLANHVLRPILGLDGRGDDHRFGYRPGDADLDAIAGVMVAPNQALFLMRPVPLQTLMESSDAGLVMPPKSTYFQPKVRSGLFVRLVDPTLPTV